MEATIPLHKAAKFHQIDPRTLQRRLEKLGRLVPKTGRGNPRHVLVRDVEAVINKSLVRPYYGRRRETHSPHTHGDTHEG